MTVTQCSSGTEQDYLEDNIATVAYHLGRAGPSPQAQAGETSQEIAELRCLVATYANEATEAKAELAALHGVAQTVPEGWQLVPQKPTELMLQGAGHHFIASRGTVQKMWEWMLSRSPPYSTNPA